MEVNVQHPDQMQDALTITHEPRGAMVRSIKIGIIYFGYRDEKNTLMALCVLTFLPSIHRENRFM
jgi:hypothetical protein